MHVYTCALFIYNFLYTCLFTKFPYEDTIYYCIYIYVFIYIYYIYYMFCIGYTLISIEIYFRFSEGQMERADCHGNPSNPLVDHG